MGRKEDNIKKAVAFVVAVIVPLNDPPPDAMDAVIATPACATGFPPASES